jgi:hypothetical protein
MFKASNSGTAAGGILPGIDVSETGSYQSINENILQQISQKCNIGSTNTMSNINIYAQSSTIGGGVNITQQGTATGSCTFQSLQQATAEATGEADNCSAAGKGAKKTCGGKGGSIGTYLLYGGIAIVVFIGIMIAYKSFKGKPPPGATGTAGTPGASGSKTGTSSTSSTVSGTGTKIATVASAVSQ